ncbi:MAG: hypothetical protein ACK8QZ_12480 [Anaerolineales bacterium]
MCDKQPCSDRHNQLLLRGGKSEPALVIGEPDASLLIQKQGAGNHPGQLSLEEIQLLRKWIAKGAPSDALQPPL